MYASIEPSSALPPAQMVGKKDAASQTECYRRVTMPNGRTAKCAQPSPPVCRNNSITADKSLYDYGVQFTRTALQAGLQGSNMLISSVAGFVFEQVMGSEQISLVCPGIKESLLLLPTMSALAGAHPVSTRSACPDGAPGCSMTYTYRNGSNESGTSYSPSFTSPTTNLNTTSEPTSSFDYLDMPLALGSFVVLGGGLYGLVCCAQAREIVKRIKYDYPEASCCQVIKAAFKYPNYNHTDHYPLPSHVIRLPVPPAQTAPAPTAPSTCEQATQTTCEQGTQTEPMIDEPAPQGQQPPTYAEATAFSVK